MRQAGRYQPEYRELRGDRDFLETCRDPELVAEITMLPLRRMPVDAAILFSDIMTPLHGIGFGVRIQRGVGPVVDEPVRSDRELARLRPIEPSEDVPHVLEAIRILARELEVPLIGFAGAPFTLASYLVEGAPSRTYVETKRLMHTEPRVWDDLMDRLSGIVAAHLRAQVEAGAEAVQLFDSWVGALDPDDYTARVLPATRRIFEELRPTGVPLIHFGVGTGELLEDMRDAGATVVGVDWRVPLDRARERLGADAPVQGNLDPAACLAPWEVVERKALDVLRRNAGRPGHVFNLGHGVLPQTDPDTLARLVDLVHARTAEGAAP